MAGAGFHAKHARSPWRKQTFFHDKACLTTRALFPRDTATRSLLGLHLTFPGCAVKLVFHSYRPRIRISDTSAERVGGALSLYPCGSGPGIGADTPSLDLKYPFYVLVKRRLDTPCFYQSDLRRMCLDQVLQRSVALPSQVWGLEETQTQGEESRQKARPVARGGGNGFNLKRAVGRRDLL